MSLGGAGTSVFAGKSGTLSTGPGSTTVGDHGQRCRRRDERSVHRRYFTLVDQEPRTAGPGRWEQNSSRGPSGLLEVLASDVTLIYNLGAIGDCGPSIQVV